MSLYSGGGSKGATLRKRKREEEDSGDYFQSFSEEDSNVDMNPDEFWGKVERRWGEKGGRRNMTSSETAPEAHR
jgi:hypothetical protein